MPDEQSLSTSTILLIEADPSLRRLMTLGLQHSCMHVIEACSLEALTPITIQSLDLLVLDVDRGMTSDWSLLEKIQSNPHLASLPIVVLVWDHPLLDSTPSTTIFSPSTSEASMVAVTYPQVTLLAKPFDARALYRTIQQLLAS